MQDKQKRVCISEPYDGSPAARAGLKAGDRIVKIDGKDATKWSQDKVSEALKGQANTSLSVTVVRPYVGADSVKTFNIVREKIKVNPVPYYGMVRGNIGYIVLNTFNERSADAVKEALLDFKKNPQVKCVALDLRGNGGGLLESAVQIVGYFVPKGTEVLKQKGRLKQNEKTYKTTEEPIMPKMPLVVLVDGGSASASEITAGSLQDLDRAVIIGARSFGKGLVQTTRQLPFDGLLKVTIAKYYIPSGRLIQEIDYSRLPQSFVLKTNNGCASHIIVRDKATANLAEINRKMRYFLNLHFGELTGQPHYTGIKPLIIAEKLMVQDGDSSLPLNDYKFNCFNGVPVCCHAFTDRQLYTHNVSEMIYDMDWNAHPEYYDQSNAGLHLSTDAQKMPACFDEMKRIAAKLSQGFPFVRVDLYDIDGRPVFGEMTFTPGLDTYYTLDFQRRLGDIIDLTLCKPKK